MSGVKAGWLGRRVLFGGLAVLVVVAGLSAFTVQRVLLPGSPRPEAPLAEAQIRQSLVDERSNNAELFARSIRTETGEWSLRIGGDEELVEWRDGQPHTVDFEAGGDLTLGVSDSGELLVADLVDGDVEVSTVDELVAVVSGDETPIWEVTGIDDRMLFGWTEEAFGAFPVNSAEPGASHLLQARDVLEVHPLDDDYIMFALNPAGENTLVRWSTDRGFTTLLELPEVVGVRDPSVGVNEEGVVYIGIDDTVWRTEAPFQELALVTQARQDRSGRWLGWVDVAPDASAWIYHDVDSGYLLTGGPGDEWHQASYLGVPIGEDFRLGDGDSDVMVAYANDEQIVVDSYEGRIWISRPEDE